LVVPKDSAAEAPSRPASPAKPKPATVAQRSDGSERQRVERASPPPPAPPPKSIKRAADADDDESDDVEEARPRKLKRKKKKKKASGGFKFPEFDFLGIRMGLRTWLAVLGAAALLGVLAWVLIPRTSVSIVEAKFVDAYAALEVENKEPKLMDTVAGKILGGGPGLPSPKADPANTVLTPGGNMLLIVREAPDVGEAVLLNLHVPLGFLQDHADMVRGTFNLKESDFLLQGDDGKPVKALLIDMEKKTAFLDKVNELRISFFKQGTANPVIPRERVPWFPQGQIEKKFEVTKAYQDEEEGGVNRKQSKRSVTMEPDNSIMISGTGSFIGKRGMKVDYTFDGLSARVTWDSQSHPYLGTIYQGDASSDYMFKSLDCAVIFPRPPGKDLVLTVMGARVGKIKPK
jgi:hypothetical protein